MLRVATRSNIRRLRYIGTLAVSMALGLYLLSVPFVSDEIRYRLEHAVSPASADELVHADAVVVLGGGVVAESPAEALLRRNTGTGTDTNADTVAALTPEAESRLLYGFRLATALNLPIVVTGGRVFSDMSVPPEASVAAALLAQLGFPADRIFREGESRTTAENAQNTADDYPYQSVIVVTSAYHMRRAILAFEAAGLRPLAAPAAFSVDRRATRAVDFMPSHHALYLSAGALREIVGFWYYRIVTFIR